MTATYPGADCETVVKSIASPIEQQMSGVDGMSYMTSVNTNNGQMSMMILFEIGTEANMDQVLSYLRYGQATSQLPSEVSALGVSLRKTSGLPALVVSLYSPQGTYDGLWLANYAYINMVDAIKRVPGVGDVQVFGAGRYAMRIWLNPEKMAALNITARDVMLAVQAQNAVNPAGKIGAQPAPPDQQLSFTVKAPGRLTSVKEFENIVVRGQDSSIVRVGDIARVELGSETYSLSSSVNDMPAASIGIYEAPGGNAIQLVDNIKALLKNTDMPPGMDYLVSLDSTLAVRAGIEDIVSTLVIALGLVVLVVFIFLQGWRGTLIPAFAVPVSIVGAFIAFPLFGFSINTICLMGLVLAIGLVVDDAIVVVEAVKNHISNGEKPLQATIAAMKEVSGPIVSTALVISCVFIPTLLLPGVTGKLFEQFAVTIGMSIIISAFCALSLSPTLSAGLLKGGKADSIPLLGPFFKLFNKGFNKARDWYVEICARLIRHMWLSILLLAAMTALLFPLAKLIPSGFLPNEDQGYLFGGVELPDNTSLNVTADTAARIEKSSGGSGRGRSDYRQRLQPHQLRPKLLQLLLLHLPETLVRTDCSGHDGGRHRRTPEKQAERGNFLRRGVCGSAAAPAWRRNVRGCHIPAGGPPGHRGKIPGRQHVQIHRGGGKEAGNSGHQQFHVSLQPSVQPECKHGAGHSPEYGRG